jgi:hypothetical protein
MIGSPRHAAPQLDPQAIEQIAQRVAELLREQHASHTDDATRLLDAAQLARRLGVSRDWVYAHANELGALVLGTGPRARLRFDLETAVRALAERRRGAARSPARPPATTPAYRRGKRDADIPLLPVYEPPQRRARIRAICSSRHR